MSRVVRWIPVAAVLVLLGAAMLAAMSSEIAVERRPVAPAPSRADGGGQGQPLQTLPSLRPGVPSDAHHLPDWIGTLLLGVCATAVLALIGALLWLALRDRLSSRKDVTAVVSPDEMRRRMRERVRWAVDEGLSDLDVDDGDPRRAVIACWARLEAAAAAAGTTREPGDTSTELVARLLAGHAITAPVLDAFAAVYREARFATHVVDEAMREQARAALRQVRDELVAGVPVPGAQA